MVTISLETYNRLRDENKKLRNKNDELHKLQSEIINDKETKVLVVNLGGIDYARGFDEVREDVEKHFGECIEGLRSRMKKLEEDNAALVELLNERESDIDELENRNLWKRILNK